MANSTWVPNQDAACRAFAWDFYAKIAANAGEFGLGPLDPPRLLPLVQDFSEAMATSTDPALRTRVAVVATRVARTKVVAAVRALAKRVQADPDVTAAARTSLGLPVPKLSGSTINPPATRPMLNIIGGGIGGLIVRIVDESTPGKRARPALSIGALVYTFTATPGTPPPADLKAWSCQGLLTRPRMRIQFKPADNGKQAFIVATWLNAKGEAGPSSLTAAAPIAA